MRCNFNKIDQKSRAHSIFNSLILLIFSLTLTSTTKATSIRALTLINLIDQSDLIIYAHTISVRDLTRIESGHLIPYQKITLQPIEILRSTSNFHDEPFVVEEMGGRLGERHINYEGSPQYHSGQNIVVFLRTHGEYFQTVGMAQGLFHVIQTPNHSNAVVARSLEELHLIGDSAIPERVPLVDFIYSIKNLRGTL